MRISDWSSDVCSSDLGAAVTFLRSILSNVLVAAGKEKPKDDELPTAVADLEKQIKEHTSDLTAILPVGRVSANPKEGEAADKTKPVPIAFHNRKLYEGKNEPCPTTPHVSSTTLATTTTTTSPVNSPLASPPLTLANLS